MQKALANYNFYLPQFLGQMVHRYSKNKLPGSVFKSLHETFDRRIRGSPQLFLTFCDSVPNRTRLPSTTNSPIHYLLTTLSFDEMYSTLLSASLNKQQTKHRKGLMHNYYFSRRYTFMKVKEPDPFETSDRR